MSFKIKDPHAAATPKQTWAIKCLGGGDVRDHDLTRQQASDMISELKAKKGSADKPVKAKNETEDFQAIWDNAYRAGAAAGEAALPTPMVVSRHENPMDDASPVAESWYVGEGACGFAWVNFKMKSGLGRKFGRWLIDNGYARKDDYYGGVTVWVSEHGQSVERKSAHATAMANVFRAAGIDSAYATSRLD